jgi:ABC-2 type transport system ATP-binding protein
MMQDETILLSGLTKRYGDYVAVDNISLSVRRGEVFSFLGMNGAGKTTTIKMMVGILRPTLGNIAIEGLSLANNAEQAKKLIGYIPDRPYLYGRLTAKEFLEFVGALYGLEQESIYGRSNALLSHYELTEYQDRLIDSYSHGMKQRLATCAALLHEPKVLIVDEPMVGLDPHGTKLLKKSLQEYAGAGLTVFLSTHSLPIAEEISHRIAIIHRGRIAVIGTMEELKAQSGKKTLEEIFLVTTGSKFIEEEDVISPASA